MSEAPIRLKITRLKEGGFLATSPDVPGLIAEGRTLAEVSEIARDVARKIVESCLAHGDPLPRALRASSKRNAASLSLTIPVGVG